MMEDITGEKPVMWGESMVGFGTYHYVGSSGREGDWPLVAFAARKDKFTVYLMDGFESRTELHGALGKAHEGQVVPAHPPPRRCRCEGAPRARQVVGHADAEAASA